MYYLDKMKQLENFKKFINWVFKGIRDNNKLIFEFFAFAFTVFLFRAVYLYYQNLAIIVLLLPSFFVVLAGLIITPILLKNEHRKFRENVETFYLVFSFWFLITIIYMIWRW